MNDRITSLQERQFGFLHNYHRERTAGFLEGLQRRFGDAVLETAAGTKIDRYSLYLWHMKRMIEMIETMVAAYGPEVMDVICEVEAQENNRNGQNSAQEKGSNSLETLVDYFSNGDPERVIFQDKHEAIIRTTGCQAAMCALAIGREELMYPLHCGVDHCFVEGFNPKLGCEVRKSLMKGDTYCEHRLFMKDEE